MMPAGAPQPVVASLWAGNAVPLPALPRLEAAVRADVVIIGAGYTGLSAAHHIAAGGEQPVILEANSVGWGASGRNGGVVSAKFRPSFQAMAARHGLDVARLMYRIARDSVDLLERLVDELGLSAAGYRRTGQIKAAHNPHTLAAAIADMNWMRAEMGDGGVSALSAEQVRAETGSQDFVGGVLSTHAGGIHPLNYARGLAAALLRQGIPIFEASPALAIRDEGGGVVVETPAGQVAARRVIIASNGYSDLTPATGSLRRRLIPFRSAILATGPLPAALQAQILPTGRICSETRRMMRWFRIVDGRLLFGGRGAFGKSDSEAAFRSLRAAMLRIFPALAGTPVAFRWSGLVGMTLDALPHVGRLDDRRLFAMGYNGTGIAMSTLMGRYLAAFARGEDPEIGLLGAASFRPVPFYALREPAVRAVAGWYQFLDRIGR